jgi:secondary thiamine-phosphate synthase enzyme
MKVFQRQMEIRTKGRGTYELTSQISGIVEQSGLNRGSVVVFCRHTSCSLVLMENADPSARSDLESFFSRLSPDGDPSFTHNAEGPDDMSAHIRMALTRTSETIPFSNGELVLGTWQGVFLWEHRTHPHTRSVFVSVSGE